jgi:predicted nucleotidyltransferase
MLNRQERFVFQTLPLIISSLCRVSSDNGAGYRELFLPPRVVSCYIENMDIAQALEILRRSEPALRARGVRRAALFGSVARGENRSGSDIDIMIEIDPEAQIGVYDYVGLKEYIAGLFDGPVDVVSRDGLKPYVRPAATADAIYAF